MKQLLPKFIILALAGVVSLSACKKDDEEEEQYSAGDLATSTLISAFSIKPNTKVLANLDSVFFSIDQVSGTIFNADSLPWGTDVRKLVVNVTVPSSGGVEIIMPSLTDGKSVTVGVSDSINFTGNGVWIRVTSADGSRERIYTAKVNVHQCNPDSLQWQTQSLPLPCAGLAGLKEQQTVEFKGEYRCLARGSKTVLYSSADPSLTTWDATDVTSLPADADINSLTATSDALYLLCGSGALMTSADGINWHEAQNGWTHLYGAYGDDVVGVKDSGWITYPAGNSGTIPAGMPVSATSRLWTFTNEWAITPQALFVGGIDVRGNYSGNAWGFDGTNWMQLSGLMQARMLPAARNMTLFPYFTFKVNNKNFMVSRQSAWIAFGGQLADGTVNRKLYVSLDNGVNWNTGADDLQLPAEIAPRTQPSVLLVEKTFTASRAVRPITSWNAPYIYLMGGYDAQGTLFNQTWLGVINRMTFKPLQ